MKKEKVSFPCGYKIEVQNLDTIIKKTESALETLRKAKTQIDELASLSLDIELKTSD